MKLNLSLQMFIATFLGIGLGLFLGDFCSIFSPLSKAYVMILKITAVPYLIVAIIRGIGQLLPKESVSLLKKALFTIAVIWLVNFFMIFLTTSSFPKAQGSRISSYNPREPAGINFADLLIPENIFSDLANNVVPSIVVFSLLIGLALMQYTSKANILTSLEHIQSLLSKLTTWISKITPLGTFFIIANQFGTMDLSTVKQVSTYIILYISCLALVSFWVIPHLIATLTNLSYRDWLKTLGPILLLAYTTNFVIVCIPFLITAIQNLLKNRYQEDSAKSTGELQSVVSLVFNIPLASLFISIFVIFLTVMYKAPLDVSGFFKLFLTTFLTSLGAVGIGSWLNCLSFLLDSFMLPQDSTNLFLTSIPFTSGFQSMVSISEISFIALIVLLVSLKKLHFRSLSLIKGLLITFVPTALFFQTVKYLNFLPPIESRSKSIYDLSIASNVPTSISEPQKNSTQNQSTLERIKQSKTLKVGITAKQAPFAFKNSHGELVGFDIAFAHQLAYDLDCRLELIPLNYNDISNQVNMGMFDIGMSAISMNESRIQNSFFSKPYIKSPIIFVLSEPNKKKYKNSAYIFGDTSLKIAAVKGTSFEELLPKLFPYHQHILLEKYDMFDKNKEADVLIWEEYEAIAWILKHRMFRIMFPSPAIGQDTLCYILKQDDTQFLEFINNWLILKENEGFFKHQFDLWIQGKTDVIDVKERRWSVVRNVLKWVD